jgi:cation-transporting ATPase E
VTSRPSGGDGPVAPDHPGTEPTGVAGPASTGEMVDHSRARRDVTRGLSDEAVRERVENGLVNGGAERTSRTYRSIVRANVFTRFNLIISVLTVVVLVAGQPADALFAIVMVVNAAVGIVQEVRAKRTLDRLRILVVPMVTVRRAGERREIDPAQVVVDDVIVLGSGDQIAVDGDVVGASTLEVDESALTGESVPVAKHDGDELLSGCVAVAGSGVMVATRVGSDSWVNRLASTAKEFTLTTSELRAGVDRILWAVGWSIVPLGALLTWSQLRSEQSTNDAMVSVVAGLVGLVPQGLVLLVSMALAVAVLRLAREHVVVQELHAVEALARVDVLCVDKTGTLTTGAMRMTRFVVPSGDGQVERLALRTIASADPEPTSTLATIADEIGSGETCDVERFVPFSSRRKWSGITWTPSRDAIDQHVTWVLGAPEILLERVPDDARTAVAASVGDAATAGGRVVVLASSAEWLTETSLPDRLLPRAVIVLSEELRTDVEDTLAYFARQGVDSRVISGDSAVTASAVAAQAGIDGAERSVSAESLGERALLERVDDTKVFGRVSPDDKRLIVEGLQRAGHTVAMTGDGVNDIPALKCADIGLAVDTATPATKAVSQLVLTDGRFDRMPHVVAEGRRVIANMERVSKLFVTKTVYSAVFVLAIGLAGAAYPFLPRQMSLVSELTIGIPAFLLSFRAADARARPGYIGRVVRFAVPAGVAASAVTFSTYWLARSSVVGADLDAARAIATLTLVLFASWVLVVLMLPLDRFDVILLAGLGVVLLLVLLVAPIRDFYRIDVPPFAETARMAAVVVASIVVAHAVTSVLRRRSGSDGSPGA